MRKLSTLAVLPLLAMLAGCGEPSADDVIAALGEHSIRDVSCAAASGQPGYVCSFKYNGIYNGVSATRRLVKTDGGRWTAAD